ncbi:hypothetical protein C6A87_006840 [Mycobacterium sp. ITM-2016-00317]|uniref:hypothetical protein n=1 Tax=Mycobacterium sp. ITM-2016-00317 TaxID=2099694 RepID=UPI00287F5A49|nr:hypothetical protein [Mycobacterium sp. ITM-2016-00317]WNG88916.1 hypothetical protein C6A87_006840 [Mycobacterium sp. ITM-2016-00317]
MRLVYLLVAPAVWSTGIAVAPPVVADCTSAGGTTICSQGDVRGASGGEGPSGAGPYVPYPCDVNDYACSQWWSNDFDADIDINPGPRPPGGPDIGRPGQPGGGGGGIGGGGRGGR